MARGNVTHNTIYVRGLQNVNRSYTKIGVVAKRNLTKRLKEASEPVRAAAAELGPSRIKNLKRETGPGGSNWSLVRLGVTQKYIYIAPVERGRGRNPNKRRPNFKELELGRAYEPALEQNRSEVVQRFGRIFDDIQYAWRT